MDALLPPKWTCSDNVWDLSRCDICRVISLSPRFIGFICKYIPRRLKNEIYDTSLTLYFKVFMFRTRRDQHKGTGESSKSGERYQPSLLVILTSF